jgi:hypothetical protein
MKLITVIFVILVCYLLMKLAEDFLRRSLRSFQKADRVWSDLNQTARGIVESDAPVSVKRLVMALMLSAGCGCYIRGMIISHYLPRFALGSARASSPGRQYWEIAFTDVDSLSRDLQEDFARLTALVFVYDSYRNPLTGFFFRRALSLVMQPKLDFSTRAEVQLTAYSVVTRKRSGQLLPQLA